MHPSKDEGLILSKETKLRFARILMNNRNQSSVTQPWAEWSHFPQVWCLILETSPWLQRLQQPPASICVPQLRVLSPDTICMLRGPWKPLQANGHTLQGPALSGDKCGGTRARRHKGMQQALFVHACQCVSPSCTRWEWKNCSLQLVGGNSCCFLS